MQIHPQRIVGAFVGSAHGVGQFYSRAVTEARDATAKAANNSRDEDLGGPVGYDRSEGMPRGYSSPIWMTFKQALELGSVVRKGETGATVVFASRFTKSETDGNGGEIEPRPDHASYLQSWLT